MKLAKKVLVLVVALALISTAAFSAFAAGSLSVSAPAKVNEGETFTVTATLNGAANFESGTFQLSWNSAVFEYVSQTNAEVGSPVGDKISDSAATIAFMFPTVCGQDSLQMATFTFKAIGAPGEKDTFTLEVLDEDYAPEGEMPGAASANVEIVAAETEPSDTQPSETEPTPTEPTTGDTQPTATTAVAPSDTTARQNVIPRTGDAGIAVAAALVVLAGAAFVASKKSK